VGALLEELANGDDGPGRTTAGRGFVSRLTAVFAEVRAEVVAFPNVLTGGPSSNTIDRGVQELSSS
jgi:hypothetical protein